MSAVRYIGPAPIRIVGVDEWRSYGITDDARPRVWNKANGYSLPSSEFTPAMLAALAALPAEFKTGQPDWPRDRDAAPTRAQLRRAVQMATANPRVISPAPTAAVSAPNAAPTAGLTTQISHNDQRIRYSCATWIAMGSGGWFKGTANNAGATNDQQGYGEVEFWWQGTKIDLRVAVTSAVGRARFRINGEYFSLVAQPLNANDGNTYNISFDFTNAGGNAPRHIVIEMVSAGFVGLNIEPTAALWLPQPRSTRALWLGDSYTALANAVELVTNGAPMEVCRRLGWDEPWLCGESGTGYLNPGSGSGRKKFRDRLAADVYPVKPDVIVIWGSINDANGSYTGAAIQAEVEATLADILTNAPVGQSGFYPRLFVIGCQQPNGSPNANIVAANNAIKAACQKYGVTFIDPTGWIQGTGRVGATTGSGNADWATHSDSVHPTDAGHVYLARRIAAAIQTSGDLSGVA